MSRRLSAAERSGAQGNRRRIEAIYCADREYSGTGHQRTEIPFRSERQAGAQPDFGAMDEAVTSWLISGRKYSLSDQADETLSFFLNGVSGGQ